MRPDSGCASRAGGRCATFGIEMDCHSSRARLDAVMAMPAGRAEMIGTTPCRKGGVTVGGPSTI